MAIQLRMVAQNLAPPQLPPHHHTAPIWSRCFSSQIICHEEEIPRFGDRLGAAAPFKGQRADSPNARANAYLRSPH
jgi:hypothetical protein